MRAILINPAAKAITEIDVEPTLAGLETVIGGYLELATELPNGDRLFVDGNGMGKHEACFDIGAHQPFAGPGLIVGVGYEALFDKTAPKSDPGTTVAAALAAVTFLDAYKLPMPSFIGFASMEDLAALVESRTPATPGGKGAVPPTKLHYACPQMRMPFGLPVELIEDGSLRLPDDGDTGLNQWLQGQSTFPEAYASNHQRDRRLGLINDYIEFVRAAWSEFAGGKYGLADIAIGHAHGDDGFDTVAVVVVPAVMRRMEEDAGTFPDFRASIIVDRVRYSLTATNVADIEVTAVPLYGGECVPADHKATTLWFVEQAKAVIARWTPPLDT